MSSVKKKGNSKFTKCLKEKMQEIAKKDSSIKYSSKDSIQTLVNKLKNKYPEYTYCASNLPELRNICPKYGIKPGNKSKKQLQKILYNKIKKPSVKKEYAKLSKMIDSFSTKLIKNKEFKKLPKSKKDQIVGSLAGLNVNVETTKKQKEQRIKKLMNQKERFIIANKVKGNIPDENDILNYFNILAMKTEKKGLTLPEDVAQKIMGYTGTFDKDIKKELNFIIKVRNGKLNKNYDGLANLKMQELLKRFQRNGRLYHLLKEITVDDIDTSYDDVDDFFIEALSEKRIISLIRFQKISNLIDDYMLTKIKNAKNKKEKRILKNTKELFVHYFLDLGLIGFVNSTSTKFLYVIANYLLQKRNKHILNKYRTLKKIFKIVWNFGFNSHNERHMNAGLMNLLIGSEKYKVYDYYIYIDKTLAKISKEKLNKTINNI